MPTYTVTGYRWLGFTSYPTSFSVVIDDDDLELDWFGGDTGTPQTASFGGTTYNIDAAGLLPADTQDNDGGGAVSSEELLFLSLAGYGWVFVPMPGSNFTDGDAINNWTAPVGWSDTDGVEHDSVICFTKGSMITTARGLRPVEQLAPGDLVITRDQGAQAVAWVSCQRIESPKLAMQENLRPVVIAKGSIAPGIPCRDTSVSRQHRVLLDRHFPGVNRDTELFAPAVALDYSGLSRIDHSCAPVTYVHVFFERHQILQCDGLWSESFYPGRIGLASLEAAARQEFEQIFPDLSPQFGGDMKTARPHVAARKAAALIS